MNGVVWKLSKEDATVERKSYKEVAAQKIKEVVC